MTIEISAPASANSVKPAARAQNAPSAGEAPTVSFLSLLGAMGLGAGGANTMTPESGATDAEHATDGYLGADPGLGDGASDAALAQMPLAADWWAAAGSAAAVAVTGPAAAAALPGHPHGAAQGQRAGLVAASAQAHAQGGALQAAAEAALSNPATRLNATSELQQLSAQALTAQQQGDAAPASPKDFMARVESLRMAAESDTATLRAAAAPFGSSPSLGQGVSMFDAAASGLHAGGALRSQERHHARAAGAGTTQGLVTWGDATPAGTQHGASSVYAPGALTPAPATAMADKVHYWVSRGVQSAELQLDAFAGGTVDVRIAVKGDEAIVEFRTDQPQARQLLLEAMPQLKELLAGEGLMLSGGFVGSSAQQGGQSQGRGPAQTAAGDAPANTPQAVPARAQTLGGVAGSRVDLFV